jgi:pSer/pThr/pTyr-binding forkhead associated (FHA) protein
MSGYLVWTDADGHLQRTEVPEHALTLGTWSTCGVVLAEGTAGPVHAALERDAVGCRLRRLSRTRPVSVNGTPVSERALAHGDRLAIGDCEARFARSERLATRELVLTFTRDSDETAIEIPVPVAVSVLGRVEGEVLVEDSGVSSRHLEIENFGPDFCLIRDLGSTNGTELNGKPMGRDRHPLREGDIIGLGRVRIKAGFGGEPSRKSAAVPQRSVVFAASRARA